MKKLFTTMLVCLLGLNAAMATVVQSIQRDVKQSDGTTLTITPYGDERVTWYRTIDEYTLLIDNNNNFVYAVSDGMGGIKLSEVIAHNPEHRSDKEKAFLASLNKKMFFSKEQVSLMRQYIDITRDFEQKTKSLKAEGEEQENYKMVVILMSFSDYEFTTPQSEVNNLFNQVGYSKNNHPGSVHDYFVESSSGKLNLSATVVGPYTADSSIYYYGKAGTQTYYGTEYYVNDLHARQLITEAVEKADKDVDFSEYTNGEGIYVSCVYVIYAGYSQSSNSDSTYLIWPHRSSLINSVYVDGVYVKDYGCSSEKESYYGSNSPLKIGTICHEFSHVLGQPDYYDTDYELNGHAFHPGQWDLMASGNYNGNSAFPPLWSAMERTVRNYVTVEEPAMNTDVTLGELRKTAKAFRLSFNGNNKEYFLLENRQQTGFDTYLPGHGLLIFRIDKNVGGWNNNCANCYSDDLGYELIPANNQKSTYSYSDGQPYPGTSNKRMFTDTSNPSSKSKGNANLSKPVYRITENTKTGNITFHIGDTSQFVYIYDFNIDFADDTLAAAASVNVYSNTITEKGFVYSLTNSVPTTNDDKIIDNTSSSTAITSKFNTLTKGATYYIRPYAKTTNQTCYGEIITAAIPCGSIKVFPYEPDLAFDLPDCWSEENFTYIANTWNFDSENGAYIKSDYTGTEKMKLVSAPLDITNLDKPILKYQHHQKNADYNFDRLKIYYKTSLNGEWVLFKQHTSVISNWTADSVELPVKSQNLYIGFEAELHGGNGIHINNVVVTDKNISSWPVINFDTVKNITDNSATFKATVSSKGYSDIIKKGFIAEKIVGGYAIATIIESADNSIGEFELTIDGLSNSTEYTVKGFVQNGGMISYTDEHIFTTKCAKIKDFPYTPDLSSDDTVCFDRQDKLILPILDLSNKDSMAVIYNAARITEDASIHNIAVYYRSGVDGQWELLNTTTEPNNQTITVNIPTLNHQDENAYIAFEGLDLGDYDNYKLNNLTVKAVSQIPFVATDTAYLASYNSISITGTVSYGGMSTVSERGFCYSTSEEPLISDNKVTSGTGTGTFNSVISNLSPLTTYYVRAYAINSYGTTYGQTYVIQTPYIPIFNNIIAADQQYCAGSVPAQLSGSLPTGGNGTYEYLWISSTDSITWNECNEGSVNTNQWYDPRQLFKTTYYRRIVTSYVSVDTSNTVTITIDAATKGGNVFRYQDTVEQYQEMKLQLRAYTGSVLYWERTLPGYDWQEMENTTGVVDLIYKPSDMGEHSYRAVVKNGVCNTATSGETSVFVKQGVGLDELESDIDIILSPNPSSGTVYINCKNDFSPAMSFISIADAQGNTVFAENMILHQGNNHINLQNLESGMYIMTIKSENIHKNIKLIISK